MQSTYSMYLTNYKWHFSQNQNKISQFVCKHKRPQTAKVILRKKNGAGGINLPTSDCTTKLQSSRQYGMGTKKKRLTFVFALVIGKESLAEDFDRVQNSDDNNPTAPAVVLQKVAVLVWGAGAYLLLEQAL